VDEVRRQFDFDTSDISKRYDCGRSVTNKGTAVLLDWLRRSSPGQIRRVLDLGGGTGRFADVLREAFGAPVVIVEPSANMIAVAAGKPKEQGGPVHFVRGVAGSLPFTAEVFDVVFVSQVLHHLPDLPAAMVEIRRVVTNRGRLLVRQTTRENLDSYFYQRFFPEARAIDEARLPARSDVIESAGAARLSLVDQTTVRTDVGATGREYVEKVGTRTYTDLAMISDEAFERGFEAFSRHCQQNPTHPRSEEVDHFVFSAV